MPTRPSTETTPDLFSTPPKATAAGLPAVLKKKSGRNNLASQPRYLLPRDLAGALKRLDDGEIVALLAAVTTEAERRGCPSPAKEKPASAGKPSPPQAPAIDGADSLSTGKLKAVRAVFRVGIKASAIAWQFGILQSDVRKAVAAERPGRKSGRKPVSAGVAPAKMGPGIYAPGATSPPENWGGGRGVVRL